MQALPRKVLIVMATLLALVCSTAQAVDTGGFATTHGGDAVKPVAVHTLEELQDAVQAGDHHIVIDGHLYGGPALTTLDFRSTDWNGTTIEGAPGGKAALENIQLKFTGQNLDDGVNIENIRIANLSFYGRIVDLQAMPPQVHGTDNRDGINYLGVSFRRVSNAEITHCDFHDISDDLIAVIRASDNVTLSYNHFYFTDAWVKMDPDPVWNWVGKFQNLSAERFAAVIGMNPKDSFDANGMLHVTLHHNWFGPNMRGRPLLRGWVHVYSNYFDNTTQPDGSRPAADGKVYRDQKQYNALQIGSGGVLYSESNYFYRTNQSHQIGLDKPTDHYRFFERGNIYAETTGASATGQAFSTVPVPYAYVLAPAASVPGLVQTQAGPH